MTGVQTCALPISEDFSNGKNPLKLLVEQLKQDFGTDGNIVTYNQSFEIARLNELANMFPEDAPFLKNLVSRVVDLLPVFQGGFFCFYLGGISVYSSRFFSVITSRIT